MGMRLITVFNRYFRKIDILRKYTFAQYTDIFNGVGKFQINALLCDENLYFFDPYETFFVLFDEKFMGKIETVKKDSDSEYEKTIEITGRMLKYKLQTSVVYKQQIYSGKTADVVENLVKNNMCVGAYGNVRYINFNFKKQTDRYGEMSTISNGQWTGGSVYDAIQPLLENDNMGYEIYPQLLTETSPMGFMDERTNVLVWDFNILLGVDRSRGNTKGNEPVIFSHSLSNLARSSYNNDISNYCYVAYVAGEGEGNNRVWIETNQDEREGNDFVATDKPAFGWLRDEIFVDARDLQKETTDKTYTDSEYINLLKQRGFEKLSENVSYKSYDSTVTNENKKYEYGKDFNNGDFVTVIDNELGLELKVQITEITRSIKGNQEITDVTFGKHNLTFNERLRKKGAI